MSRLFPIEGHGRSNQLVAGAVLLALSACDADPPNRETPSASSTTAPSSPFSESAASSPASSETDVLPTSSAPVNTSGPMSGPSSSGSAPPNAASSEDAAEGSATHDTTPSSSDQGPSSPPAASGVTVQNGEIFVDGVRFQIRGVNWNPVPKGGVHPSDLDFAGFANEDAELMQAAGINAVRTYEQLSSPAVLDVLLSHGIYVFTTVYGWWQDEPDVVTARVDAVKDHPAVLGYVLGNEWNYNQLYASGQITTEQARDQINAAAALVKQADPSRPVATIYGELGGLQEMIATMPDIDLWGVNTYRGISFGDLFDEYSALGNKPLFLGEFGADAYNANIGAYDPEAQATATTALLQELQAAVDESRSVGGFLFEWADEWWKDAAGSPQNQDVGGVAPGGGPYPDQTFNEEWWGIVDIDRTPRPAYEAVRAAYAP